MNKREFLEMREVDVLSDIYTPKEIILKYPGIVMENKSAVFAHYPIQKMMRETPINRWTAPINKWFR